ncbi:membrane protein insertase YidC [Bacillus massiliglaciei]|uniref:membrane protein insertase YidC n=1 Tax=Bacillus massiliglaciei TaxID=1816693 RepID=UPI000A4070BE|nr:membrane protein insertase YidC [Bacillus massiliglaciei]
MKKIAGLLFITVLLSGCSANTGGDGFFHRYFVSPLIQLLEFNADLFHGNYGWGIILATLMIRLVLMPLTAKQYKNQAAMKKKMEAFKPEMTVIQEKIKQTQDPSKKAELQQEMFQLYKKHGVNPLNMGCLPMLIQMPILMGFYYAIKSSHEIATHNFLWYSLGQADIIMALVAGLIYYFQFRLSLNQMPAEQQGQMKFMGLLSPLMILFISFSAPAALPLYWSASGIFLIIQTIILQKVYKRDTAVVTQESSGTPVKKG